MEMKKSEEWIPDSGSQEDEMAVRSVHVTSDSVSVKIKILLLAILTCFGTTTAILGRYTMIKPGEHYIKSTVVVLMEIFKFVTCVIWMLIAEGGLKNVFMIFKKQLTTQPMITVKVAVPAFLYVIQNNLLLLAYSYLNAITYQVTYQLKILTTAIFYVTILKKSLRLGQWFSLVLLMIGVSIVSYASMDKKQNTEDLAKSSSTYLLGLATVVGASLLSGFSGVYFEKVLKGSNLSLFLLNTQLAVIGILIAVVTCFSKDNQQIKQLGFFVGYDISVWGLVIVNAVGGLMIAVVMKYADNILKGFSTSISIVLSGIVSYALFGTTLTPIYILGVALVIISVLKYALSS